MIIKDIVRAALKKEGLRVGDSTELLDLESKIDSLTLITFDNFMRCREKLYELRAIELKNTFALSIPVGGQR